MDKDYWQRRWEQRETGWHQTEVEPALVNQFSKLKPTKVFVPFCGKSLDLLWLASQGHQVVGVELSEVACLAFFSENELPFIRTVQSAFTLFSAKNLTIFNGDFFSLKPSDLGGVGAVYDRASLIALPSDIRPRYAQHMKSLVAGIHNLQLLQIVLERTPTDTSGPPFSVSEKELHALYGAEFEIKPLSRETINMGRLVTAKTEECVYLMNPL